MIKNLSRLFEMMGRKKYIFFLSVFITSVSVVGVGIINSFIYKNVVNSVFNGQVELFNTAVKLSFISLAFVCIITPFTSFFSMYLCHKTSYEIRTKLYLHLIKLPMIYFNKNGGGEILSKLLNDFNRLKSIYDGQLYQVIFLIMNGSIALIAIIIFDWRLSIVIILLGVLSLFINVLYVKPVRVYSAEIQCKLSKLSQRFIDICFGNRVAKLFNAENIIFERFDKENTDILKENINLVKKEAHRDSINYLFSAFSFISILGIGAFMVAYKLIDPGTVIAIFSLRERVEELFVGVGSSITNIQKSLAGTERILEFIDEGIEDEEIKEYRAISKNDDIIITMKDIDFSYDGDKKVINSLNLNVKRGEILAFVGASGSGKSTILKLLMGLYKPQKGEILLSSEKDSDLTLSELREQFAYVSQEAYLFDLSLRENIILQN